MGIGSWLTRKVEEKVDDKAGSKVSDWLKDRVEADTAEKEAYRKNVPVQKADKQHERVKDAELKGRERALTKRKIIPNINYGKMKDAAAGVAEKAVVRTTSAGHRMAAGEHLRQPGVAPRHMQTGPYGTQPRFSEAEMLEEKEMSKAVRKGVKKAMEKEAVKKAVAKAVKRKYGTKNGNDNGNTTTKVPKRQTPQDAAKEYKKRMKLALKH